MDITKEQLIKIVTQTTEQVTKQVTEQVWSLLNKPVAKDKDGNVLNSNEEILQAAEEGRLSDDFDYEAFRDCKDDDGYTPAHAAAVCGHLPDDFDYTAFKDYKNSWGNTPAHFAASNGYLLDDFDYGAFKDCKNSWGYTPADMAERCGHLPGRFANAREAEAFDYSLEEDNGPR
jgi:hypothetical protein